MNNCLELTQVVLCAVLPPRLRSARGATAAAAIIKEQYRRPKGRDMVDTILKDPVMRQLMYPYLPEEVRNPKATQQMMDSPEVRAILRKCFRREWTRACRAFLKMLTALLAPSRTS
ncbi:hypothetical protein ABBQ32_007810 [Trebouxia sp. C0010 RCD-2024]